MASRSVSRRTLGQTSAAASLGMLAPAVNVMGANERVSMGFIGCSGRGRASIGSFLKHGAVFRAVCDVDRERLERGKEIAGALRSDRAARTTRK